MAGVLDSDDDDLEAFPSKPSCRNPINSFLSLKNGKQKGKGNREYQNNKVGSSQADVLAQEASRSSLSVQDNVSQPEEVLSMEEVTRPSNSNTGDVCEASSGSVDSNLKNFSSEKLPNVTVCGEGLIADTLYRLDFTFLINYIALELLDDYLNHFKVRWPLSEIVEFSFNTNQQMGDALLELSLDQNGAKRLEYDLRGFLDKSNFPCDGGFLLTAKLKGFDEVQERQITSLSDGYKSRWRPGQVKLYELMTSDQEHMVTKMHVISAAEWHDLVYPKGDPDAVTVTMHDFLLLNPHEFISDTIIDFYIKHLQSKLPETVRKRLHFFNSFFFRKLDKLNDDLASEPTKTSSAFEHIKRWTKSVNIFKRDFLLIPVLKSAHWSLIIVSHPGFLFDSGKQEANRVKETAIVHFDSMEGCHRGVEGTIEKYLVEHWGQHRAMKAPHERNSYRVKIIRAEVPQQTNYSDCGVFMLHYVEMFLQTLQNGASLTLASRDWFKPADVADKRNMLKMLIQKLQEEEIAQHITFKEPVSCMEVPAACNEATHSMVLQLDASSNDKHGFRCNGNKTMHSVLCEDSNTCTTDDEGCNIVQDGDSGSHSPHKVHDDESSMALHTHVQAIENADSQVHCGRDSQQVPTSPNTGIVTRFKLMCGFQGRATAVSREGQLRDVGKKVSLNFCGVQEATLKEEGLVSDDKEDLPRLTSRDNDASHVFVPETSCSKQQQRFIASDASHVFVPETSRSKQQQRFITSDEQTSDSVSFGTTSTVLDAPSCTSGLKLGEQAAMEKEHAKADLGQSPSCSNSQQAPKLSDALYISSDDDESGFVKVQKIVEASKARQQTRRRKPAMEGSNVNESHPPNANFSRWRLRRKSQLPEFKSPMRR